MNLSYYIARKLSGNGLDGEKVSKPAIRIATIGVAVGVAVVLISIAVVMGFKHSIRDKVVGFGCHVTVANFMTLQTSSPKPIEMPDSMLKVMSAFDHVTHVQRYALTQGILKTDDDFLGVTFKGVDEGVDTTFLNSCLVEGSIPHFSGEKNTSKILLSKNIAEKLHVKAGDRLFAYFLNNGDNLRARRFTVEGIYQTNLTKYDEIFCFVDLHTVVRLNGWKSPQVTGAELSIDDFDNLDAVADVVIDKVNKRLDSQGETYSSATVVEQNPPLFSWLDLLDLNVWVIMALMVLVAGFTIVSGLLIIILERSRMIGLMKALGARNSLVRHTFVWLALFVVGKGLFWGNILGLGICLLQHFTGIIQLDPATYYVDKVPVELSIPMILLVNGAAFAVSVLVLVLPSYFVSTIHPARSMRYE